MYKKERIVDLKALIRCVLEKWKGILLVALIAAAFFGGLKGFNLYKAYKQGQAQAEVEAAPEEDSQGASKAIEMRRINKQLDLKNAYFTESIMGDIDPTKEGFASADVIVSIDNETGEVPAQEVQAEEAVQEGAAETASTETQAGTPQESAKTQNREMTILNFYGNSAVYRMDLTNAAKQLGTTANKLQELISFKYSANKNSFITIKVIYPDQQGAKLILDEVISQLRQMVPEAVAQYGPHTMMVANELDATINDTSMYKWAYNRATEIVQLINSKKTLDKNLSSGTDVVVEKTSKRDVIKGTVKQACTGAVGGALACVFLIVLYLLATGKVLSARELNNHFELQKIACVPGRKFSTRKGLDKLVASIDASYYNHPKRAVCLQVADAGLGILFSRGAQVALVSDLQTEYLDKICVELNKAGSGKIRYYAVPCSEQTPEAVAAIENCDAAVVVARAERSSYKGVGDVLSILRLLDREAIGSIVFM